MELNCIRDAAVADGLGGPGLNGGRRDADGGFLVGGHLGHPYQNGGGVGGMGGGRFGSGTMMVIAIVAAVITGTAVAFLIIFVRKW